MSGKIKAAWVRGDFDGVSEKVKAAWTRGDFDGAHITHEFKAKMSQKARAAWARGDFNGVFVSPTQPERIIKKLLEERGIEYEFQFHLGSYYYDFYIPNRNLLIEYDGIYWHSLLGAKERDEEKTRLAIESGYMLTRLQSVTESEVDIRFLIEKGLSR